VGEWALGGSVQREDEVGLGVADDDVIFAVESGAAEALGRGSRAADGAPPVRTATIEE
jgi:hypothetical protein